MHKDWDALFEYLRNILYQPDKTDFIDKTGLSEEAHDLALGLDYLLSCAKEQKRFATALSNGNLNVPLPPADDPLCAPLKRLHGTLNHISWQTGQVAKGDYSQTIDFMGEFALSFNTMVRQLAERQAALEHETEMAKRQNEALRRSQGFSLSLTENTLEWIALLNGGEYVYVNSSLRSYFDLNPGFDKVLLEGLLSLKTDKNGKAANKELELYIDARGKKRHKFYIVSIQPSQWDNKEVASFFIRDITKIKREELKMKDYAMKDALTGLYNRRFAVDTAKKWALEGKRFCLSMIDLDMLKRANDDFGHGEGDRYITRVAGLLDGMDAIACRIGGDEFMILSEEASKAEVDNRLEELRSYLIAESKEKGLGYRMAFSYGTAVVSGKDDVSISMRRADISMYEYKFSHKESKLV